MNRAWVGRKHATFREADEFEADENARRSPAENIRLVLLLQGQLGRKAVGLREAARRGDLKVGKINWKRRS